MKRLFIILIMLIALSICFAAEYSIVLQWDEMEGELNGVLTGVIEGNRASVSGIAASNALDGKYDPWERLWHWVACKDLR